MTHHSYPLYDYGGAGPLIHMAVGNGFPPSTYGPLLASLTDRYHALSLPPRPLWNPPPPPASLTSWRQMAGDLLAGLRQHNLTDVIALGHSMGGAVSTLAVIAEPERFRALVLLDPTFMSPSLLVLIRLMRIMGQTRRFPIVAGTLRRRTRFASLEEACDHWREKPLCAGWPDEVLRLYAEGNLRPASDGGGLELAWSPQWEAHIYQLVFTGWPREVPKLRGLLPVLVVQGEHTDTFVDASARVMKRLLPDATYVTLAGRDHRFPQSAPHEAGQIVADWLDKAIRR